MKHIFAFLLLFFLNQTFGQLSDLDHNNEVMEDEVSRVHFIELNFTMYAPLDVFAEKIEKNLLYGFSFAYLMQLQKEKPSFMGLEAFHMNLGSYARSYEGFVGNEQLQLTGKVASNALGINLIYRYYVPVKLARIEPYLEGHLGVKWLYSYLSESGSFLDEEPYDNFDFLTGKWVLTYGGALGFQIHISDIYYLNLKSTYHFAVSGKYQKRIYENLSNIDFPQEAFESVQSSTNVAKIDFGFTVLF